MTAAAKSKSTPAKKARHNPEATERHRKAALKEVQAKIAASGPASAKAPDETNNAADAAAAPQQGQSAKVDKKDKPAKGEGTPKQLGGLDAAAIVLKAAGTPLTCKEIWGRIDERKMWFTEGKTPEATIYSAILREIVAKGKESRFRKAARGKFEFCGKEG